MQNRWGVLALVVVARTARGFQFQSIAAVGSFLVEDLGLSYAQLGTLIGLYLLTGAFISLPGALFYALSFACMGGGPAVAGYLVDRHGEAAALWLPAALWLMAWPALGLFRALQGRWTPARTA
jgi:hypothetical protein